jgi:histidine triad (HIT) family protein
LSENPLSPEQQNKLLEISKLKPEEQQVEFSNFIKTLNKEQIEFLKKQQMRCPFCSIGKKEIKSLIVYEDESVMGILDINPANKGHVILFPLEHVKTLMDLKDVNHIFSVAKKLNEAIIKGLDVKGTNILVSNGQIAGQVTPHFVIHIIPREEDDGLNFVWGAKKFSEDEMEEAAKLIRKNLSEEEVVEEKPDVGETANHIYKSIERIP